MSEPLEIPHTDRRMQQLAVYISVETHVTIRFESWKVQVIEDLNTAEKLLLTNLFL
jgi:hypothetical protein